MAAVRRVTVVNLTGHPLRLGNQAHNLRFRSSGRISLDTQYAETERVTVESEDGTITVPLLKLLSGDDDALPEPQEGVLYVVSGLVAGRVKRPDIVAPARLHRESGRVLYARALLRHDV